MKEHDIEMYCFKYTRMSSGLQGISWLGHLRYPEHCPVQNQKLALDNARHTAKPNLITLFTLGLSRNNVSSAMSRVEDVGTPPKLPRGITRTTAAQ